MVLTSYRALRESIRSVRGSVMVTMQSMGFWRGLQHRAYVTVTANAKYRFHAERDFVLQFQNLYCDDGRVTLRVFTAPTSTSGPWTKVDGQQAKCRIGAAAGVVPLCEFQVGGTFAGGTERELLVADSGSGVGVGFENRLGTERGLPAGDYYFDFVVQGTTYAVYTLEWEELSTVAGVIPA